MVTRTVTTRVTAQRDLTRANGVDVLSWPAVLAAAAVGIAAFFLLSLFIIALAYNSDVRWFFDNLSWLYAGASVVSLLLAGMLAGWLGQPSGRAGIVNGLTVWGLLVAGTVVFGVESAGPLVTLSEAGSDVASAAPGSFWPRVVSYSVGLVLATGGGFFGGMLSMADTSLTLGDDIVDLRNEAVTLERDALVADLPTQTARPGLT